MGVDVGLGKEKIRWEMDNFMKVLIDEGRLMLRVGGSGGGGNLSFGDGSGD
ncbi:hypothetical protein [Bacillus velezensis]|uniref:hypothetical protein n=1 Tax=Bacillus velezensis TaxID=492670 RepID=UPI0016439E21|nr:hypothetical protein [Bacillus velezensis]